MASFINSNTIQQLTGKKMIKLSNLKYTCNGKSKRVPYPQSTLITNSHIKFFSGLTLLHTLIPITRAPIISSVHAVNALLPLSPLIFIPMAPSSSGQQPSCSLCSHMLYVYHISLNRGRGYADLVQQQRPDPKLTAKINYKRRNGQKQLASTKECAAVFHAVVCRLSHLLKSLYFISESYNTLFLAHKEPVVCILTIMQLTWTSQERRIAH